MDETYKKLCKSVRIKVKDIAKKIPDKVSNIHEKVMVDFYRDYHLTYKAAYTEMLIGGSFIIYGGNLLIKHMTINAKTPMEKAAVAAVSVAGIGLSSKIVLNGCGTLFENKVKARNDFGDKYNEKCKSNNTTTEKDISGKSTIFNFPVEGFGKSDT